MISVVELGARVGGVWWRRSSSPRARSASWSPGRRRSAATSIITWNTVYLELALAEYVRAHGPVAPEVLAHLSPALMEHVNQYGTYTFPIEKVLARQGFRPLRAPESMIPVLD
jgi:hypothetical protein